MQDTLNAQTPSPADTTNILKITSRYECAKIYFEVFISPSTDTTDFKNLNWSVARLSNDYKKRNDYWCSEMIPGKLSTVLTKGNFFGEKVFEENTTPRDFQNTEAEPIAGGTLSQSNALPSVEPISTAGGNFSTGGTESGSSTIVALTLNPSIFFIDPEDEKQTARYGRLSDLTVFFPTDAVNNDTKDLSYFGIRARINTTGISDGSKILKKASSLLNELTSKQDKAREEIKELMSTKNNFEEKKQCVLEIKNKSGNCYESLNFSIDQSQLDEIKKTLQAVSDSANSNYFGLDLRFDSGDPTFGADEGASGTRLFGGFAFGKAIKKDVMLKFRMGVDYFDQDNYQNIISDTTQNMIVMDTVNVNGKTNISLDSALGFEFSRKIENQSVNFSSALELRLGFNEEVSKAEESVFQTNYLMLRNSLSVPITSSNKISLNLGVPIFGEIGPVFSISANWSLLLPGN